MAAGYSGTPLVKKNVPTDMTENVIRELVLPLSLVDMVKFDIGHPQREPKK